MEYTTIIGIVIAVIIMLFGVRMIFRKPADAAPSLESALHIDADSQKPIIPRHVRDQLQTASVEEAERQEPTLNESSTSADASKLGSVLLLSSTLSASKAFGSAFSDSVSSTELSFKVGS